jgi:hypothetical protein
VPSTLAARRRNTHTEESPMPKFTALTSAAAILVATSGAHAAVAWDESVQGDLSNVGSSPTFVALSTGTNQIIGTTGNHGSGTDRDMFRVTVPAGFQLSSLQVLTPTTPLNLGFLGIQSGSQITSTASAAALAGWTHYTVADRGTDVLARIGTGAGAVGFTGPLGSGNYAFWIQDFDAGVSTYAFDLTLAAVPEPSTAAALLMGLAGIAWVRRKPLSR